MSEDSIQTKIKAAVNIEILPHFNSLPPPPHLSCGASIRFQVMASPYEASLSHSDTPHSVGFLCTSDQPDSRDLYLTTHNIHEQQTSKSPWDSNPQSQQAGGRRSIILRRKQNHFLSVHACMSYHRSKIS